MKRLGLLVSLIVIVSSLASCATPTPKVVEKVVTQVVTEVVKETVKETVIVEGTPQIVEKEVTKVVEVEKVVTPTPVSKVGGKFVWALTAEPDTLDAHRSNRALVRDMLSRVSGTLVARDPQGNFVPYLAESWTISEDGLTWDFFLKKGIKWDYDGEPFTAHDYVWTFERVMDPESKATGALTLWQTVESVEAIDDYHLRITLKEPFYLFLMQMTKGGSGPLYKKALEELGEQYGRNPVGVGPWKFKEWLSGERIVFERNPDFNWGPDYAQNTGPFYIETLEFRIIPEAATIAAGLESGEIDFGGVSPQDLATLQTTGNVQILTGMTAGLNPWLNMNVSKPPFDDVRVRKAFNLAVDKQAIINAVFLGQALPQYGPISRAVSDYWEGGEEIGYKFDLEQAKALMQEAGYVYNNEGMLEKDGEPFKLPMLTLSSDTAVKVAEMLKEQYGALGVDVEITQGDIGLLLPDIKAGNFTATVWGNSAPDSDIMYRMFHSSGIGNSNRGRVNDPELDKLLEETRTAVTEEAHTAACYAVQKYMIEQAYFVSLATPLSARALNNRVKGAVWSQYTNWLYLNDAYIETE